MLRTLKQARDTAPERLWAEIDLGAVRTNVATLRRRLAAGCGFVAVVKADGYGHGALAVAQSALAAGADELAVADAREGSILRAAGVKAPILVLGPSVPGEAPRIVALRLVPTVMDLELAAALQRSARGPLDIEVEVDTGMRRHGVAAADAPGFLRALRVFPALRVRGVFTHFAGCDAAARPWLIEQWQAFAALVADLRADGRTLRAHACNTLGTVLLPEAHADAVRIGGGLYGFAPGVAGVGLVSALALKTRVAALRRVVAGDRIGYGGVHTCAADGIVALLPCGYADGLSRAHWDGAEVLVRGRRRRLLGHVSMNQAVVEVDADVAVGDEVVLLGAQGQERVTAEERAHAGVSPYEVTALLRPDLARRWLDAAPPPAHP